jgi:hypothetical protein
LKKGERSEWRMSSMVPMVALIVFDQLVDASVFPLNRYNCVNRLVPP